MDILRFRKLVLESLAPFAPLHSSSATPFETFLSFGLKENEALFLFRSQTLVSMVKTSDLKRKFFNKKDWLLMVLLDFTWHWKVSFL